MNAGATATALGSALCYGLSSATQQRSAMRAPAVRGGALGLTAHLIRRPAWLIGQAAAVVGLLLHALALSLGPLTEVQPLLVSGLLFALPISLVLHRRRASAAQMASAALLVAGLSAFLLAAMPSAGSSVVTAGRWLPASVVGVVILIGLVLVFGARRRCRHRALALGAATGMTHGLSAVLLKYLTTFVGGGASAGSAQLWILLGWGGVLLLASGAGLVLNQAAFAAGPLAASLPALTIADPVVASILGAVVFSEYLAHDPVALSVEVLGGAAALAALLRLARERSSESTQIR